MGGGAGEECTQKQKQDGEDGRVGRGSKEKGLIANTQLGVFKIQENDGNCG